MVGSLGQNAGAWTQSCFTLTETANGSDVVPLLWVLAAMLSCSCPTMAMNFLGYPYFDLILYKLSADSVKGSGRQVWNTDQHSVSDFSVRES